MRLSTFGSLQALILVLALGCQEGGYVAMDDDDVTSADDDDTSPTDDDDSASGDDDDFLPPPSGVYFAPALDFGELALPCADNSGMELVNATDESVVVDQLWLSPEESVFALILPVELPWALAPGDRQPFAVTFAPLELGETQVEVLAATDHPDHPEVTGSVEGEAVVDDEWMDGFTAAEASMIDILWIVDNSCSMVEEQETLSAMAGEFLDFLQTEGLDFQVGVVSTDFAELQGAIPIVSAATLDPAGAFALNVLLGTAGSGTEQPINFGYQAVTPPMAVPGGPNEGLVREHAGLALIALTDEDDQSSGGTADWVSAIEALKADPDAVNFNGVHGLTTGCTGDGGSAYAGARLHEVVAATGGAEVSICDTDWMPVLSTIPDMVAQPQSWFPLTFPAIPSTLEVTVADTVLTEGWTYDEPANAVVFDADHVPDPGVEVLVYYGQPAEDC